MFFLGYTFLGNTYSGDPALVPVNELSTVVLENAKYEDLYITKDTSSNLNNEIDRTWNYDTVLHGKFKENNFDSTTGTFMAGNVMYLLQDITKVRVRRRVVGTMEWTILYEIETRSQEDFSIQVFDRYAKSNTQYEYQLVPILTNVEGIPVSNTVRSEFEGMYIVGKEKVFGTPLDTDISIQRNHPAITVNTLGKRYPFVIYNTEQNYDSGTAEGIFAERDENRCDWKIDDSANHRRRLNDFLSDGTAKILKHEDGRGWIIGRIEAITETRKEDMDAIITSFEWVEIGDLDSTLELYNCGLVDVDPTGW